jgi:hypothetical protein
MPATRFDGVLEVPGAISQAAGAMPGTPRAAGAPDTPSRVASRTIELRGWRGMVGHNWGAEHAERWIWLHGIDFPEEPRAWIDVALGRVRVAGRTTPWVANGALHLDGERYRLGGLGARGLLVAETPQRCTLSLPGPRGLRVEAHIESPHHAIAGWRYTDPQGNQAQDGQHDVANCSIAALTFVVRRPGLPALTLRTPHGAVYELGMRERDHGIPLAPYS